MAVLPVNGAALAVEYGILLGRPVLSPPPTAEHGTGQTLAVEGG